MQLGIVVIWSLLINTPLILADFDFDFNSCGLKKLCLFAPHNCTRNGCRQIVSFSPNDDDWVTIEIFERVSNPKFNAIAVGFSNDDLMGDEPVTHCSFGEPYSVHLSYNDGKSNVQPPNKEKLERDGLQLLALFRDGNHLYCKFRQRIHPRVENSGSFSLDKNVTLFVMHSVIDGSANLKMHTLDSASDDFPTVFSSIVNFATPNIKLNIKMEDNDSVSKAARRKLILLHGCLMIVGWMFFVSVGISASRYLKGLYKNKNPLGAPIWFQIHRAVNITGVLFILAGTGIIFFANDFRWTGPLSNKSFYENLTARSSMHSLTGFVAVFMAFSQPIGALFRCHPGKKDRKIFEVIHHTIGRVSFVVACISLILALLVFHVWSSHLAALITTTIYFITLLLYIAASEVLSRSKDTTSDDYELAKSRSGGFSNKVEEILRFTRNVAPRKRYSSLTTSSRDESSDASSTSLSESASLMSAARQLLHPANKEKAFALMYAGYCTITFFISLLLVCLIQRS